MDFTKADRSKDYSRLKQYQFKIIRLVWLRYDMNNW